MAYLFLIQGLLVGLSISAPVGPMGLLCIRRTLALGKTGGFLTGLGVATADGLYSSIAAFGISSISTLLQQYALPFRLFSATVLATLGMRIFMNARHPSDWNQALPASRRITLYLTTLALALSNPLGILFFIAFFAGSGLADTGGSLIASLALISGVILGSLSWWIFLTSCVAVLGRRLPARILLRINQASGMLITLFGVLVLL